MYRRRFISVLLQFQRLILIHFLGDNHVSSHDRDLVLCGRLWAARPHLDDIQVVVGSLRNVVVRLLHVLLVAIEFVAVGNELVAFEGSVAALREVLDGSCPLHQSHTDEREDAVRVLRFQNHARQSAQLPRAKGCRYIFRIPYRPRPARILAYGFLAEVAAHG